MRYDRMTAALLCAAMLFAGAAMPEYAALAEEITETTDTTEETTERFGHYGPLTYEIMEDGLKIISCDMDAVSVEIPPEIDGVPVTEVAFNTFGSNDVLETVVWNTPASTTFGMFRTTGLKTITFGQYAENADVYAFDGCEDVHLIVDMEYASSYHSSDAITEVTLTDNVSYTNHVFLNCQNLRTVHIGAGLKVFDSDSFLFCPALEAFEIAEENADFTSQDGIVYSKDMSELLRYPAGLTAESFTVPESVRWVFRHAFIDARVREVILPEMVDMVGESAFLYAENLETIQVPEYNPYYYSEDGVLYDARYQTLVQYPNGKKDVVFQVPEDVQEIGMNAFTGSLYLKQIIIPENVQSIREEAFRECISLQTADISAAINTLEYGVFEHSPLLQTVTLPETLQEIRMSAFADCTSLRSVYLPAALTTVGSGAFRMTDALTDVYYGGTVEEWGAVTIESDNDPLMAATIHYEAAAPEIPVLPELGDGDISGEGETTVLDVILLKDYLLGRIHLYEAELTAADVNYDGAVNAFDLATLKKILLNQ